MSIEWKRHSIADVFSQTGNIIHYCIDSRLSCIEVHVQVHIVKRYRTSMGQTISNHHRRQKKKVSKKKKTLGSNVHRTAAATADIHRTHHYPNNSDSTSSIWFHLSLDEQPDSIQSKSIACDFNLSKNKCMINASEPFHPLENTI